MLLNLKNYIKKNVAVICVFLSVVFLFFGCEITHPYYFLQDDNADWYVCSFEHTVRSAFSGELALYNFHQFSGIPHLDKGQSGVLNPMVYLAWILSHALFGHSCAVIEILAFIYSLMGGIAMFYLLKKLKLNEIASVIGGISWAFNAFSIVIGANWIIIIMTAGCFPLMILTDLYLLDKFSIKRVLIASVPRLMCLYIGHPQFFIYSFIFEVMAALTYLFVSTEDKKTVLPKAGKYILSFIPMGIWSLPLLLPMFFAMQNSADRGGNLDFDTFFSLSSDFGSWLFSLIYPFTSRMHDYDLSQGISGDDGLMRMQTVTGHIGYIMVISFVASVFLLIKDRKKRSDEKDCCFIMLPGLLVSSLWTFSMLFNRVVYYIPVINRFRWPFKILMFVNFFMIAVGAAGASYLIKIVQKRSKGKASKAVGAFLVLCVIANFSVLYFAFPARAIVFENSGDKPYSDPFCSIIGEKRYISKAGVNISVDVDTWRITGDAPAGLDANFATYYGLNSRSGYDQLVTTESAEYRAILEDQTDNTGMISSLDETEIYQLRLQGVSFYVARPEDEDFFSSLGIEKVAEDKGRVLFYDPNAMPLVYVISENGEYLGEVNDFTQKVNSLEVNTDEAFENGYIVFNYVKQRNFHGYIDGKEVPVERGVYLGSMVINCPAGKHQVSVVYEDHAFTTAVLISVIGTLIVILVYRIIKNRNEIDKNKTDKNEIKTNRE